MVTGSYRNPAPVLHKEQGQDLINRGAMGESIATHPNRIAVYDHQQALSIVGLFITTLQQRIAWLIRLGRDD